MSNDGFELRVVCSRRIIESKADPVRQKRAAEVESARQQAALFAHEALLVTVSTMRTTRDDGERLKAAKMIMDRAWGVPKTADDANETEKNQSIIELLASMSTALEAPVAEQAPRLVHQDMGALEGLLVDHKDA